MKKQTQPKTAADAPEAPHIEGCPKNYDYRNDCACPLVKPPPPQPDKTEGARKVESEKL